MTQKELRKTIKETTGYAIGGKVFDLPEGNISTIMVIINQHVKEIIGEYEQDTRGATGPADIRNAFRYDLLKKAKL